MMNHGIDVGANDLPDVISGDAMDKGREMMSPLEGTAALSAESIIYSGTDESDDYSNDGSGNGSSASFEMVKEEKFHFAHLESFYKILQEFQR